MRKIFPVLLSLVMVIMPLSSYALNSTTIITPSSMATSFVDVGNDITKWFFYNDENDTIDNSIGSFVTGPDTAPTGAGSVQMSVSGTQRRNLATYQFRDVKLADIDAMSFSTYSHLDGDGNNGLSERAAYLQFNVDFDNSDIWQRRLTFVPALNGDVISDTWQTWDAINSGNALWTYSGSTWPNTAISGSTARTWSDILASYPNAETRSTDSFLGFRIGEPYANGFTGNIDNFKITINSEEKVFNFEPYYPRMASITGPTSGQDVYGTVNFSAFLNDDDVDAIQWAVRQGTCNAGQGTVFGNVDGHNNSATLNTSDTSNQTFNFSADMSNLPLGIYCFVYNPVEDVGESNIRETVQFNLVNPPLNNPTDKNQCKKGGWVDLVDEDGHSFKNQGQCVSWVNHQNK